MPTPVARLQLDLAALDRAYSAGHHGRWSGKRRAELVDAALTELFEATASENGGAQVSLAAIGGYGRGALAPGSDIDLLLLHDGADPGAVAKIADALFYPLWDAGFEVGHAVRTPSEALDAARERLDSLTAQLDARLLAGDPGIFDRMATSVRSLARRDPQGFAMRLRQDAAARKDRYGSAAHLLEPELKEGAGGLRDLQAMGWLGLALGSSLEAAGLLRARERDALDSAEEFLMRVRSALHLDTDRRTDRLVLDHQPAVARAMGFQDEPRLRSVDGLMRAVFEHARQVSHVTGAVFDRYLGQGERASPAATYDTGTPGAILAALADTAEAGRPASLELLDDLESASLPDPVLWTDGSRDAFLRILRAGEAGVAALDTLDRLGLLVRFLPEWQDVRCRPQRDPYHRFTVDAHLTEALAGMGRMLAHPDVSDPLEREAAGQSNDRDALLLGALLHDIGKTGEGSHVKAGARVAQEVLDRLRVTPTTRDLAAFMVAEHLLLPDTATRRDLTDDDLILGLAARVGTPERLAALYLLAKADAVATGPSAWTPWRRTLIEELVGKIQRVFDRGEMGAELAERLTDSIGRLRDLLDGEPEKEVERFILRMPRGYFLTVEPARAARHYATIAPPVGVNEVRTASSPGSRTGSHELLVVALDRPGLLSWIAGALSLAGLSILTAQVFTTEDRVAVDLFEVEGAWEPEIGAEIGGDRWRTFRRTLRGTIEGTVSVSKRVDEKRRYYPPPRADSPVTVDVENAASDFFTVIEIGAPDRIGLLYDITSALADLQLDVHLAKVATYTGRVVDTFYVRDTLGRKISHPQQVSEIAAGVRTRLEL